MSKKEMLKRYIIFFIGLLLTSFGVAFVTKSALGTSPIAAIPYSLSLIIPRLSLGNWIIIFNLLLIIIQIVLLRKDAKKIELILQVGISFVFGYFIDFSMMCLHTLQPEMYGFKIISLLTGCVIIAFGVYLEVIADVVMLPGDAFVRAITKVLHKEYGGVRIVSDVSMTVVAGALCLIFLHKLSGVREGTIIAALITGSIVKIFIKRLNSLTRYLLPEKKATKEENTIPENNFVLTISREYGSGGREIGQKVAEKLGVHFYDAELIRLAAQKSGYAETFIEKEEQKISKPIMHDFYAWYTSAINEEDLPDIEKVFIAEERIIKEIAVKESCVIVGRLSNYILQEHKNSLHVFISADMNEKIRRVVKRDRLSEDEANKKIKKVEKERKNHCQYFSNTVWGESQNYDITLKSNKYGIDKAIDILVSLVMANHSVYRI